MVRVGILHSLSGPLAVSERSLRDATLLAIAEINAAGGVLGQPIEPVGEDYGSNPQRFVRVAERCLAVEHAVTLFGGWSSTGRKALLPVLEQTETLLWYPLQYEGLEQSPWVIYGGSCPNQQLLPVLHWLRDRVGRPMRLYFLGSDYVFPRVLEMVLRSELRGLGMGTLERAIFVPLDADKLTGTITDICALRPDAIFNALNGSANLAFYRAAASVDPDTCPIIAVSASEMEMQAIAAAGWGHGHYASWSYFQSLATAENQQFVQSFKAHYGFDRVTSDPIEAAYTHVYLWKLAVERAGTWESAAVRQALPTVEWLAPGGPVQLAPNLHRWKFNHIGRLQGNGQFAVVHSSPQPIEPLPWLGLERETYTSAPIALDLLSSLSLAVQRSCDLATSSQRLTGAIAEVKREANQRQRAELEAKLLLNTARAVADADDFDSALQVTLTAVGEAIGWDYGEAWILGSQGQDLVASSARYHRDQGLAEFHRKSLALIVKPNRGLVGRASASLQIQWIERIGGTDAPIFLRESLALSFGLQSAFAVPIAHQDQLVMVLAFLRSQPTPYDPRVIEIVQAVALQLSALLQRKQAEAALSEQRRMLATLMDNLPGMAYRSRGDRDWTLEFASIGCQALTGHPPEALQTPGTVRYAHLIHPDDRDAVWQQIQAAITQGKPFQLRYRLRAATGEEKWIWEQGRAIPDAQGGIAAIEGFATEITAQKQAEMALEQQLNRAILLEGIVQEVRSSLQRDTLFNTAARKIGQTFSVNRCTIHTYLDQPIPHIPRVAEFCEPGWERVVCEPLLDPDTPYVRQLLATDRAIAAHCQPDDPFLGWLAIPRDDPPPVLRSILTICTSYQGRVNGAISLQQFDYHRAWSTADLALLEAAAAQLGIAIAQVQLLEQEQQQRDILARQNRALQEAEAALVTANRELERMAMVDGLTGIANRRQFDETLTREWRRLRREHQPLALLLVDVDYFKRYNDHYGHQAGDWCLTQIAGVLRASVQRPADLVARYGGEEFVVILPNTKGEGAVHVAERIRGALKTLKLPHASSPVVPYVTVSIGIACQVPRNNNSAALLLAAADEALYEVKQQGRDAYCLR